MSNVIFATALHTTTRTIHIGEIKIGIFKYPENYRRRHNLKDQYFLNAQEVCFVIDKSEDSVIGFAKLEENRRQYGEIPPERKDLPPLPWINGLIQPMSLVSAKLYWLQWAVLGNSKALKITRFLMYKSAESLAERAFEAST